MNAAEHLATAERLESRAMVRVNENMSIGDVLYVFALLNRASRHFVAAVVKQIVEGIKV